MVRRVRHPKVSQDEGWSGRHPADKIGRSSASWTDRPRTTYRRARHDRSLGDSRSSRNGISRALAVTHRPLGAAAGCSQLQRLSAVEPSAVVHRHSRRLPVAVGRVDDDVQHILPPRRGGTPWMHSQKPLRPATLANAQPSGRTVHMTNRPGCPLHGSQGHCSLLGSRSISPSTELSGRSRGRVLVIRRSAFCGPPAASGTCRDRPQRLNGLEHSELAD